MADLLIQYRLRFADGTEKCFDLRLDGHSLDPVGRDTAAAPDWTAMDNHRCPHCPLDAVVHPTCPAACAIAEWVTAGNDLFSYEHVQVEVRTPERLITAETSLQRALSSLLGLALATSGCPHTAFLKPMARFHLPFASEEETIYRATSMYLLAQYFRFKQGDEADLDLSGLTQIYRNLHVVNTHMAMRMRSASEKDAAVNAVVILDMFAKTLPQTIDESLEEIRYLFAPYLPNVNGA
ncbi:MAG: hypothetical protein HY941_12730 [Gammaproteobacteria bacterium]|nr:hypothetical protein [Gammaproteobacteria bacterium]